MRRFKSLALAFALALFSQPALAFTLTSSTDSTMKGWANPAVVFNLNPANCPSNIRSIISDAMKVWNGVPSSSLDISLGANTATTVAQLNGGTATDVPVIICDTNFGTDSGVGGNGIAGIGRTGVPAKGGNISYGYLLINLDGTTTGDISNASSTVVSIVLAHEIGHVLGLGHSADSAALMYYDASNKQALALAQDDIDGITYLYPRNEPDKIGGCSTVRALGSRGGPKPPTAGLIFVIAVLLAPIAFSFGLRKPLRV